jgi:dihydroorotate dehydrogenase electron transfer subunit
MMRYFAAEVADNERLGGGYYRLDIAGCEALKGAEPGQFVMVRGDWDRDPLLPRAFSLLAVSASGHAQILAKTVGRGTALLERAGRGTPLSLLGPLGTQFPAPDPAFVDLLVGGGVGIPPLYMQAGKASRAGRELAATTEVLYGGRSGQDLVLLDELRAFGVDLHLATEDGTVGRAGRVTVELAARLGHHRRGPRRPALRIMACGPNPMLWAVAAQARADDIPCFLSVEEQMACGIGVCLGCAIPGTGRPFRYVCKDGPVFPASELRLPDGPTASAASCAPAAAPGPTGKDGIRRP